MSLPEFFDQSEPGQGFLRVFFITLRLAGALVEFLHYCECYFSLYDEFIVFIRVSITLNRCSSA